MPEIIHSMVTAFKEVIVTLSLVVESPLFKGLLKMGKTKFCDWMVFESKKPIQLIWNFRERLYQKLGGEGELQEMRLKTGHQRVPRWCFFESFSMCLSLPCRGARSGVPPSAGLRAPRDVPPSIVLSEQSRSPFHRMLREASDSVKAKDSIIWLCDSKLTSWIETWSMHKWGQSMCGLLPAFPIKVTNNCVSK